MAKQESEGLFRALFQYTKDAVIVTDPKGEGRVLLVNPAACQMFGYTEDEFLGLDRQAMIDMADPRFRSMMDERERTGEASAVIRYRRKDGSVFAGDLSIAFFRDEAGLMRAVAIIRDVTGRKQAEEALRESEMRQRLALRAGGLSTWCINLRTGEGSFSHDAGPLYGMPEGWTPTKIEEWAEHIHPDDRERVSAAAQAMVDSGALYHEEFRVVWPDGTIHWLETQGEVVRDTSGKAERFYGVFREVTERRQAEEAIRESNMQFRAMFGSTNVGMAQADPSTGRLLQVNAKLAGMLGYSESELIGTRFSELTHPDEREADWRDFGKFVRGEIETYNVEKRLIRKDGGTVWVLVTVNLMRSQSGEPLRTMAVISDITIRKKAEETLRRSEKKYRDLVETANSIIIRWDKDEKVLFMNEFGLKFFGYTGEDILGRDVSILVPHAESTGRSLETLIKDITLHPEEYTYFTNENVRKNGEICWVAWTNRAIRNDRGEVEEILAIGNDVTHLKRTEAELRKYREHLEDLVKERTAELREKNRKLAEEIVQRKKAEEEKSRMEAQLLQAQKIEALGSFAGGIAHDLNNILYPITINTEMLLEETDPGSESYEMLEQTLKAAYRQRDLVKQILSFSRQDVQKLAPVHITPLLEETLNFIRSTIPSTIEIRSSIDAETDTVLGDSVQIQQVIMNLCKNAADALESEQGLIEVSLSDTHVDIVPGHPEIAPGKYLVLTVRDTGHGMPPEVMDRIFDPFYTTKPVGKGSGMGLSVVHGILKKHGGSITVESEENKGSRFTVYLPLYRKPRKRHTHGRHAKGKAGMIPQVR